MEIIENKLLLFRTRNPERYTLIPKSRNMGEVAPGIFEIAVKWSLDEVRVLRNLGVKNVPSPIQGTYNWPGRFKPFEHQIRTASFLTLHNRAYVFNDPGTGKSLACLWAADYLMTKGLVRRCLIVCPLSIMEAAWMKDLMQSVIHRKAAIAHAASMEKRRDIIAEGHEFVIINYDGVEGVAKEIIADGTFDLVICDECFVAGTPVWTEQGSTPIETLVPGQKVLTTSGPQRIRRIVNNPARALLKVGTSNGKHFLCTPEHPFFTDVGWVAAKNLSGRRLISKDELRDVQLGILNTDKQIYLVEEEKCASWAELLSILRTETVLHAEPRNKSFFSDVERVSQGSDWSTSNRRTAQGAIGTTESSRACADNSRRQRYGNDCDGISSFADVDAEMGMELHGKIGEEARRLSIMLQTRFRKSCRQSGFRSGWGVTSVDKQERARREKRNEAGGTWVESVSYIKQRSPTLVYNIEVEGAPNYFVGDGFLVHNCNFVKNANTRRWKAINAVCTPDTRIWALTGTPAPQSPVDAFGLAKLVTPCTVPKFITAWKDKTMMKVSQFKWIAKGDAPQTVHRALQPAIRFTKAMCLDLPPVLTSTRKITMTAQQDKYYRMMKIRAVMSAGGETVTAVNAATVINKLLQISAGAVYSDGQETVVFDCKPRLHALDEILDDTDKKVIVFAPYRSSIDTIVEHLVHTHVTCRAITGDVTPTKRGEIFNDFQSKPDPRVLVIQPQAAAHGVTLTAADTVVFWGPVTSVETYIQCIARADRIGQKGASVTVVHLQSSDIEARMFRQLESRVEDHEAIVKLYNEEMKELK